MKRFFFVIILFMFSCETENSSEDNSENKNIKPIRITKAEITITGENNGSDLSQVSYCYDKNSFLSSNSIAQCLQDRGIPYSESYIGSLKFFTGREDEFVDVTNEIINNSEHYLVVFRAGTREYDYTYEYLPEHDKNGKPLGINFRVFVQPLSTGSCPPISVHLKFAPNIDKSKVPFKGDASNHSDITESRAVMAASVTNGLACK